ncbi:ribonuclease H-like domain-containing protein [Tanacetum coccineum]
MLASSAATIKGLVSSTVYYSILSQGGGMILRFLNLYLITGMLSIFSLERSMSMLFWVGGRASRYGKTWGWDFGWWGAMGGCGNSVSRDVRHNACSWHILSRRRLERKGHKSNPTNHTRSITKRGGGDKKREVRGNTTERVLTGGAWSVVIGGRGVLLLRGRDGVGSSPLAVRFKIVERRSKGGGRWGVGEGYFYWGGTAVLSIGPEGKVVVGNFGVGLGVVCRCEGGWWVYEVCEDGWVGGHKRVREGRNGKKKRSKEEGGRGVKEKGGRKRGEGEREREGGEVNMEGSIDKNTNQKDPEKQKIEQRKGDQEGQLVSHSSSTIVRSVEVPIVARIVKPGTILDTNRILEELLRTLKTNSLVGEPEGSNDFKEVPFDDEQILRQHNTTHVTPPPLAYTPTLHVLATMDPLDTFLIGDEVISIILERENDEFIKSSVDDIVPILRESELTLDSTYLECSMPIELPLPCTDVLGDAIVDIDLLLGEHLDTLSIKDREIDFNPIRDIEELERLLADNLVLVPRVFDAPLVHPDSISRSFNFGPPGSTPVIDESALLVTPLHDSKEFSLGKIPYDRDDTVLKKQSRRTLFTKEMDLETTQINAAAKLPHLKQGPITTEEKAQKKNDVKARNLEIMSFDDLYNNFKIVEQEVKRTGTSSSNLSSQNMAFVSTFGSTNEANIVNVQVSTANSSVSIDSTLDSTTNLSDATVYAFLANQPNGSQLVHEDLEQIHEDDLEEMDLKWQLAILSMRARKYYQRTGKKITINGSDTAGYDKSKVECFNCHKMGHFARECRGLRNQESRPRNQDSSRRTMNVEDISSKAMVAIDGAGFDWRFMAEKEVTTNMTFMAFSDSKVYNDKTCSNTCLKIFEALKTQLDNLRVEFNKSKFNLATYKRGLASVEEQLVFYKKNEVMFCDQIVVLKRDASFKDSKINGLKIEIEKLKYEKESNQIKINKFENAFKSLDKLIGSQISDNSRKYVGYNVVPPPPTGLFTPSIIDLSYFGLEEFQQPKFEGYGPKSVCVDTSNEVKKTSDTPLVEELVSKKEKKTVFPKQQDKTTRKQVKYAEMYRSQKPKGNQRNWNNLKSQQLGSDFMMYNKACFVCGSFDHIQAHCKYHQRERMVFRNNYNRVNYNYTTNRTHPNAQRNMVPRAVLMKSGLKSFNTTRTVNNTHLKSLVFSAKPLSCFSKSAQSTVKRPYQSKTVLTNKNFSQKVNTSKVKVNTVRPKAVNTTRPNSVVVNAVRDNQENVVKASACWVWRPTKLDSIPPTDDQGYVDSGCYRHMTGNISYLLDFQEFDGGYVTFGGGVRRKNHCVYMRPDYPDKVCKVVKALYGLHQAPRAWYETLAKYLLDNGFHRGKIDQTLFIKKQKGDILLVQVYVDDIIFGSTKALCLEFEKLMHDKFQMSFMGELTFFLGLQVKQKEDGIFISHDKYVTDILKKFGFQDVRTASTPMDTEKPLLKDSNGDDVDVHLYRSMIGSLMYLTSSRLDIMFLVCACARFQVTPKVSHSHAVKRIFIYLKGKPKFGLWYPRDSPFHLVAYFDSDYVGASLDRKSTTGGCQFLGYRLISWQCKKQTMVATSSTEAEYVATASCCGQDKQIEYLKLNASPLKYCLRGGYLCQPWMNGHVISKVGDKVVHKELGDKMEKAVTTASSLEAEQDNGNINRTQSMATLNEPINTLGSGEDSMKLMELMAHCTKLSELFLGTTTARITDDGEVEITASIDGQVKTITEASLRRHLKLEHSNGTLFSLVEVFHSYNPSLFKTFNFSKMIFDAMVKNLDSTHKFLMYPRFLQICLNKQKRLLQPHTRTYLAYTLIKKLFSNMKRASRGYYGVDFPLFPIMITTPESSPSRITSSPSLSPQTYQSPQSSPLRYITRQDAEIYQSQFPTQTQVANKAAFTSVDVDVGGAATTNIGQGNGTMHKTPTRPHDLTLPRVHTLGSDEGSLQQNELIDLVTKLTDRVKVLENDLQQTKKVYSSALTKLIIRVKKLEHRVKTRQPRRRARVIISDTEEDLEDPSKQGRRIAEID